MDQPLTVPPVVATSGTMQGDAVDMNAIARAGPFEEISVSFLFEFWGFLRTHKKFWLAPIVVLLLILGGLVVLTQGSVFSQFLYPDF